MVVGFVLGEIVIGMGVTMVEPWALVVVRFANEAGGAELVEMGAVASDGVTGPCAADGVVKMARRGRRRRGMRIMTLQREGGDGDDGYDGAQA